MKVRFLNDFGFNLKKTIGIIKIDSDTSQSIETY